MGSNFRVLGVGVIILFVVCINTSGVSKEISLKSLMRS